jgi:hypothetical protein
MGFVARCGGHGSQRPGNTKHTGQSFPAQGQYAAGKWTATMQIPDLQAGAPFAVAIWNGSQQDRDGRKYFTIWYRAQ